MTNVPFLLYFQARGVAVCEALGRGDGAVLTKKQFNAQLARMAFAAAACGPATTAKPQTLKRARE